MTRLGLVSWLLLSLTLPAAAQQESSSNVSPAAIDRAIAAVLPSLVRIQVIETDYYSGREMKSQAIGSGVIVTPDGYVVTNHHVAGKAKHLTCRLADKEEVDAELTGSDPITDIAVIKLKPKTARTFPAARFGDSTALKVGEPVLAMGSPEALSQSVTLGIISNTELVLPDLFWPFKFELDGEDVGSVVRWIGHDAAINPGNSGGPLVNLAGEVVGINELDLGLGGAIPGNLAKTVAEVIIRNGTMVRAWLGLEVQPLLRTQRDGGKGALIGGAIPESPAERAGFQPGDMLLALNGVAVTVEHPEDLPLFNQLVSDLPIGKPVEAVLSRGVPAKQVTLTVTADSREAARPREREFADWGMAGRNMSALEAKERKRTSRDGVLVTSTRPGGPCEDARPRIISDDVIVAVAGKPVRTAQELAAVSAELTKNITEPIPVMVAFERKAERYVTVARIGKKPPTSPAGEAQKAWLGVNTQVLTREIAEAMKLGEVTGVRITQVLSNTSAAAAGLRVGDLILALDGAPISASRPEHVDVFPALVRQYPIGSKVEFTVVRDGMRTTLPVTLDSSPKPSREMKTYRDDTFEFTVREVASEDRVRQQLPPEVQGVLVESATEGGWAALAHLAVGDVILRIDGRVTPTVAEASEMMKSVSERKPDSIVLAVRRGIHTLFVELMPKWTTAAPAGPK